MKVSRRGLLPALALGAGQVQAQQPAIVAEERLQALAPILARRKAQLEALRGFVIDDAIGPTPGLPRK